MTVTAPTVRKIRALCEGVVNYSPDSQRYLHALALEILPAVSARPAPKKAIPTRKQAKEVKRAAHREKTGTIREAVMERAGGCCECCGEPATEFDPLEMDHAIGGGMRRIAQGVETCWALKHTHHAQKTLNRPDKETWVVRFRSHCIRVGVPVPRGFRA